MNDNEALRVLYVEDDPVDAMLLQEVLSNSSGNFDIVHVDTLKAALKALQTKGYSAVLLDLNLKDVAGMENVRAISEECPDIPIVILTGLDDEAAAAKALRYGAQEYLVKGHGDGKVVKLAIKSSIERKGIERALYKQANYDEMTGLPNRRLFQEILQRVLDRAKRWKYQVNVLFVDLNHFKDINDTYGHEAGNSVLREVARRMTHTLRASDVVARYGGDEFVVLLDEDVGGINENACEIVSSKIHAALSEPFVVADTIMYLSASIGAASYPEDGNDIMALLEKADGAMYRMKRDKNKIS